jgi:peptidyl-prolyl cis-trans isomerase D
MAKKKGTNTVTLLLLILLVAGLAGFGVTNFGGSLGSVARVGSTEITTSDYARAVEAQLTAFQRQTGQQLTVEQGLAIGVDRQALGQLLTDAAIEDETKRIGISVGDANVLDEIRRVPAFQGVSGEFDRQTYELTLRQNDITVSEFEEQVRNDLAEGLVRRAVGAGVATPAIYVDTLFDHARETRDVTWARLTAADLAEPLAAPSEAELQAYYEAHTADFTRPETKAIHYAWLTPDMLAPNVTVDEAQIRKLYDDRIADFVRPERRLVERLVFATQADADAAKARLDAGETDFDGLVAGRGLALTDVDLGDVAAADLGAAADAVFALAEPGVVGPLPSDLGPALFRMNGILPAEETTFEEAKADLATEAAQDRARRIILDLVPQVEDMLAGGADPALLAERTDMEEGRIDWNTDVFDGIAAYEGFRQAAATAKPEDFPGVVELEDGGIVVLKVDEVRPPEPIPFAEVRDDVTAAWTRQKTGEVLAAQAEALAEELRNGREMAGMGLALKVSREMTRDAFLEETPPDFTRTVFGLEKDGIAVLSSDGDAWLVRLDAITPADPTAPEAQAVRARFAGETAQSYSTALTRAFTKALIDSTNVEINSSAVSAVNAQLR